jgi:hypothetical protein
MTGARLIATTTRSQDQLKLGALDPGLALATTAAAMADIGVKSSPDDAELQR